MADSQIYTNGMPDLNKVRAMFAPHGTGRITHVTTSGDAYEFNIVRSATGYDAIIERQPGYNGQDASLHATHRLPATGNKFRICLAKPAQDLPTMIWTALLWAEGTSWYRRTGGSWR